MQVTAHARQSEAHYPVCLFGATLRATIDVTRQIARTRRKDPLAHQLQINMVKEILKPKNPLTRFALENSLSNSPLG